MQLETRIKRLVAEAIAERPTFFLVDVKMLPHNRLVIQIDSDEGVHIQDCVTIGRYVGFHLEEENAIETAYNLEVTSPGVGEPLKLARQYVKNVGRNVSLKLVDGSKKEGKLLVCNTESVTIEESIKQRGKKAILTQNQIALKDILETRVLISFK